MTKATTMATQRERERINIEKVGFGQTFLRPTKYTREVIVVGPSIHPPMFWGTADQIFIKLTTKIVQWKRTNRMLNPPSGP